ncbi:DUF4303 domain-containing protein [Paenalcaligenes sp. Me131]|uniref:DUF4303 domain-containing protein n=1 Tax=Paenalcaligenes sp. Me131 TaxID=3392636 RepID=UPI003D2C0A3C
MDWKAFKACLFEAAKCKLEALLSEGVEPLYAAAFFASYREQESVIGMPSLAANNRAMLDAEHPNRRASDECFDGVKWSPVDWHWNWDADEYGGEPLAAYEAELEAYANRGSVAMWDAAEKRFMTAVAQVASALRKHFAKDQRVAKDFVVYFQDEYGGADLAQQSIPKQLFFHHFPELDATEQERQRIATLPVAEQAACYTQRLGSYEGIDGEEAEKWVIACGAAAIPALLDALAQRNHVWKVAMILGLIGEADAKAIEALRQLVITAKEPSTVNWSASALGYLGDFDWMMSLVQSAKHSDAVVTAYCAPLRAFRNRGAKPVRLDYKPLEKLLTACPEMQGKAEEVLEPGSSYCTIGVSDVPEACRGLSSPFAVVRRHAACVLDERTVGESLGAQGVEPIQALLATLAQMDTDESVRYLAGLTVTSMKKWRFRKQ